MAERDGYEHGTPCWVDHASADPEAAAAFYVELLGWETEERMPPDAPGSYRMCRIAGRDVAAIGSQATAGAPATWTTYVAVADADAAASAAREAGGRVLAGPFDVPAAGRMAALADPSGAAFAVWQAGEHRGAQLVNEPGCLCWNELTTRDVPGSIAFYARVLGWHSAELDVGGVAYRTWHLGDDEDLDPSRAVGGLMPMVGDLWPRDLPPHWMTYFAVADADETAARAEELGGTVSVAPFDTSAGRIAVLTDPLGAVVSAIQLPGAGAGASA